MSTDFERELTKRVWTDEALIWLVPVAAKFKLLALRQAAHAQDART